MTTGIDVFGRGTLSYRKGLKSADAIGIIKEYGMSFCIFAPGYFYEKCKKSDWKKINQKFWTKVYLI